MAGHVNALHMVHWIYINIMSLNTTIKLGYTFKVRFILQRSTYVCEHRTISFSSVSVHFFVIHVIPPDGKLVPIWCMCMTWWPNSLYHTPEDSSCSNCSTYCRLWKCSRLENYCSGIFLHILHKLTDPDFTVWVTVGIRLTRSLLQLDWLGHCCNQSFNPAIYNCVTRVFP